MEVTHPKVSTQPDGGDPTLVLPSDWNAVHTVKALTADPSAPVDRQIWWVITSDAPPTFVQKIRRSGVTYTLQTVTF